MTIKKNNPWAGLTSYEDPAKSERKLEFCGRDNDIYDVAQRIDDNLLLILYGKSGIGKTSLLNAGVFPRLRLDQYLPVSIRLDVLDPDTSYQESIISAIENAVNEIHGSVTTCNVVEDQTDNRQPDCLWNYFARHRFVNAEQKTLFPVVVLDQFEEVLRNTSIEHVVKAQMLLNQLQYLIDENHALGDCFVDGKEYYYDFNFRFVISIREDELYLLEDNIDDLSLSLFRNSRYRLRSLSEQGAAEAVLLPGKDCISDEQKQAVVDRVIALSKRPQSNDIDTLLLSLVCSGSFDKKVGEKITVADLAVWKNNPMEVYYQDATKGLTDNQIRYIQQHLIREDGSRKRVDADEVKHALGEATYYQLTQSESRLLAIGDKNQVELLHDQLGMAVYEERKHTEEKERRKKQRRSRFRNIGIVTLLLVLGLFVYQNRKLKNLKWGLETMQSRFIAEKALKVSEYDSYLAIRLLLDVLPKNLEHPNVPYTIEAEKAFRESYYRNSAILSENSVPVENAINVVFSPDGKLIAAYSENNVVKLWNSETGKELSSFYDTVPVAAMSFRPNGDLLCASLLDDTIKLMSHGNNEWIRILKNCAMSAECACFNPDGDRLASAGDGIIKMWDVATGTNVMTINTHCKSVTKVAYSPDGSRLVSAFEGGGVKLWDANSGVLLQEIELGGTCISMFFHQDEPEILMTYISKDSVHQDESEYLMTYVPNGSVTERFHYKIWDYFSEKEIEDDVVPDCGFYIICPDWSKYAYADKSLEELTIVDAESKMEIQSITNPITAAFDPVGNRLAYSTSKKLGIIDARLNVSDMRVLKGHKKWVNTVSYNAEGSLIVSASGDGTIKIWDANNGKNVGTLVGHEEAVCSACFSPNGEEIVSASADSTIRIWNAKSGQTIKTLEGHSDAVLSAVYSPDGKTIVSTSCDNTLMVWDAETFDFKHRLEGHVGNVNAAVFSPDGKFIASASDDSLVIIWDANGKEIRQLKGHNGPVKSINFSNDGKRLLSSSSDNTIMIWDVGTGIPIDTIDRNYFVPWVNTAVYRPDGRCFISGTGDNVMTIWDAKSLSIVSQKQLESDVLYTSAYSPDGRNIIMSFYDGSIIIWSYPPLQELIDKARERFKDSPLTEEERRLYYLE